jgi:hypothetical protein
MRRMIHYYFKRWEEWFDFKYITILNTFLFQKLIDVELIDVKLIDNK